VLNGDLPIASPVTKAQLKMVTAEVDMVFSPSRQAPCCKGVQPQ